jgi:hypothetical protein
MKKLTLTIILLLVCQVVFADKLEIMFSCYPKDVQQRFAKAGKKLDLSGNDRDANSWGFIENQGSRYNIYTYKQMSPKELMEVQKIIMEN